MEIDDMSIETIEKYLEQKKHKFKVGDLLRQNYLEKDDRVCLCICKGYNEDGDVRHSHFNESGSECFDEEHFKLIATKEELERAQEYFLVFKD